MNFQLLLSQKAKDYFASQRLLLIVAFMLMAAFCAQAQTATKSGNWNDQSVWGGTIPNSSSNVVIKNGYTVTVNINTAVCANIQLGQGSPNAGSGTLVFQNTSQLSVGGNLTIGTSGGGSNAQPGSINMAAGGLLKIGGSLSIVNLNIFTSGSGTIEFNGTGSQTIPALNFNNLASSNTGARTLASTGTIGVAGNFTPGTNSYTVTGSTVNFDGTASQTIPVFNFNNLTSSNTGARTLASTGTIGVAGNFTPGTNSYNLTGSTVNFNGTGSQTIPAFTFSNLTVNNGSGATLTGAVSVIGTLTLQKNLTTGGNTFRLLSSASGTARVDNIAGVVVGNATVERFITANTGLGYRHYSSPVQATTVADLATTGFTPVFNAAYNSNPYANYNPYPNVFGYNQNRLVGTNNGTQHFDYGWYSPASNEVMAPGKGYTVNILGTQKVDFVGTLNNGNVTVSGLKREPFLDAGWHLLGNPYPSSIDWGLLTKPAGMDGAVYIWRSSGEYTGTYDSYVNGVGGAQTIAAMQGFFVHVNSSSPINFTFTNAARTSASAPFYRTAADQRPQLQLSLKDADGLADDTYVYFQNEATVTVNGEFDAYKVQAFYEDRPTLFANFGESAISIKGLPLTNASQSVPLEFYVPQSGNYTFSVAKFVNFPAAASVQLLDKKTNQSYDLSQGKEITIALTTTEPHRFVLNFSAVAANPLSAGDLVETGVEAIVYPNPAKGDMNLVLSGHEASPEAVEVVLYNTLGQLVLRNTVSATQAQAGVTLQTSNFAGGIYHLHIKAAGKTITKKVVLSR